MIFNMSGGGSAAGAGSGAGLNFKVVGGTTEPTNPAENTIWVNTDTEIISWTFSATEPETPVEGMVWIFTDALSPVEFNALKKNGIMVYPCYLYQYIDSAWVSKEAKTYQNGVWTEWTTYLYYEGNEYTVITGGFSQTYANTIGTKTFTKNSDSLYLKSTGTTAGGSNFTVATAEKIDLTNYSTLYARVNFTMSQYTRFGIGAHTSNDVNVSAADCQFYTSSDTEGVIELDISSLSGEYYILVGIWGYQASNNGNCYVYEVYLK